MRSARRDGSTAGRALALVAALALAACYSDVKVVQGTVTEGNSSATTLTVRDERAPNASATYRLERPVTVATGDLVRLAYRESPDGRQVVRAMNLTRHRDKAHRDKK
jgi:hypothetical protein